MRKCQSCGSLVNEDSMYCIYCGKSVDSHNNQEDPLRRLNNKSTEVSA